MPLVMYYVVGFDASYYIIFMSIITLISISTSIYFLKVIKHPDQTDYAKLQEENL